MYYYYLMVVIIIAIVNYYIKKISHYCAKLYIEIYKFIDQQLIFNQKIDNKHLSLKYDGAQRIVMIKSYNYAKKINTINTKRKHNYLGYIYKKLFKECIGTKYGNEWLNMKKPLDKYFNSASVKYFYDMLDNCITEWFNKKLNKSNVVLSLSELDIDELTMKFLLIMIFGKNILTKELNNHLIELKSLSKIHNQILLIMGNNYAIRYGFLFGHNEEIALVKELCNRWILFIEKMIELSDNDSNNLISHLINIDIYNKNHTKLIHTLYELILFNTDIMINAISYLLWDIGTNADVRNKLTDEISYLNRENITYDDISNLCYLNKVINESARLHPGVIQTFSETNIDSIILDKYEFSPGTQFSIDVNMVNRDPKIWKNANKFDPERYLTNDDFHKIYRFGLGPRRCIGRIPADYILKKVMVKIFLDYSILMSDKKLITPNPILSNLSNGLLTNKLVFIKHKI